MNERVKEIRVAYGLKQSDFAKRLGVTSEQISRIEGGKRNLTDQMTIAICREFNVNEEWLRTGIGDMFVDIPTDALDRLAHEYNLPNMAKRIVKAFVELDAPEMNKFFGLLRDILDDKDAEFDTYTPSRKRGFENEIEHAQAILNAQRDIDVNHNKRGNGVK